MVFGNNSQVTEKEMDFPSGEQFIFAAPWSLDVCVL